MAAAAILRDITIRRVAPVLLGRIFLGRVLRVVNHHVGIPQEFRMAAIAGVQNRIQHSRLGVRAPEAFPVRLMVADVHDGDAVRLHPVAQRDARMIQPLSDDPHAADFVFALGKILVIDPARPVTSFTGK